MLEIKKIIKHTKRDRWLNVVANGVELNSDRFGQMAMIICVCDRSNESKRFPLLLLLRIISFYLFFFIFFSLIRNSMSFPFRHVDGWCVLVWIECIISISYTQRCCVFFYVVFYIKIWVFFFSCVSVSLVAIEKKNEVSSASGYIIFIAFDECDCARFYVKHFIFCLVDSTAIRS